MYNDYAHGSFFSILKESGSGPCGGARAAIRVSLAESRSDDFVGHMRTSRNLPRRSCLSYILYIRLDLLMTNHVDVLPPLESLNEGHGNDNELVYRI